MISLMLIYNINASCSPIPQCAGHGFWNGTNCICFGNWSSVDCSYDFEADITCYNSIVKYYEENPYCECVDSKFYGSNCSLCDDNCQTLGCTNGTCRNFNGSYYDVPTCSCFEDHILDNNTCICDEGYNDVGYNQPCEKITNDEENSSNGDPNNNNKPSDFEKAQLGLGIFFGITGIIGAIVGVMKIRVWKTQKNFEGRSISWASLIFCGCYTVYKEWGHKKKGGQEVFSIVTPETSSLNVKTDAEDQDSEASSGTSDDPLEV